MKKALISTDYLKLALENGGFMPKGFTFSGSDPPEHLIVDGGSVTVGLLLKWFPKGDYISINCGKLNFAKRSRGKKSVGMNGVIPEKLTNVTALGKSLKFLIDLGT